jgi:putative redox protein
MADKTLLARWGGGYRADITVRGFDIAVDEPASAGGDDTGPTPTELFLASLAGCFTLAVAHVARKTGVELDELSVRVDGDYEGFRFADLRVVVQADLAVTELEPLVEKAKEYCFVSRTVAEPCRLAFVAAGRDGEQLSHG